MHAGKSQFSPSGKRTKEEAERLFYEVSNPDALPKSLQRNQWTLDRLNSRLIDKLEARASKGSNSFRVAFMQFTRDPASNGVTYENFHEDLRSKFGFVVSREDSRSLYDRCDADGKGYFTFSDFAKTMFPHDYTQPLWNVRSEDERSTLKESRRSELMKSLKLATPREEQQPGKSRPARSLRELEEVIQDKIMHHTSKKADQFRQAFRLFSDERGDRNGFTREAFKFNLRKKFGVDITAEEVDLLFDAYDADKSGTIDFHEFVTGVLPRDYTATPWNIASEARTEAAIAKEKEQGQEVFVLKEYPKAWNQNKWTLAQVEQRMRDKITAHTSRSTDQFRQAFRLFRDGHGGELTKDRLRYQLSEKFGIVVTDQEVDALFLKYDKDGSGTIDFYEFVTGLMPPDYSRKNWSNASEERANERRSESKRFYQSVARPVAYGFSRERTVKSILQLIATKIAQHTPGDATAASAKRLVFRWFQLPQARVRTHGSARSTSQAFRAGIKNLHFLLTPAEMDTLESRYRVEGEADMVDVGKVRAAASFPMRPTAPVAARVASLKLSATRPTPALPLPRRSLRTRWPPSSRASTSPA